MPFSAPAAHTPLPKPLRTQLENTVKAARDVAEKAGKAALVQLAVAEAKAPDYLNAEQRALRRNLRAHGRALGDSKRPDDTQELQHLVWEVAYEHWHRMLFARFLAENNLLMWEQGAAVSLDDCRDMVDNHPDMAMGAKSHWELAAKLAARMLPQIFKPQSPVFELRFSINEQRDLEILLNKLPLEVFQASDSLGWVYQFWQAKRKDEVNASEVKIGADELPAVTQLFTEPYMVDFLLHNSLGAWWHTRHPGQVCPVPLPYQYHGQDAMTNPMLGIKNRKKVKKKPDPLTPDERDLILVDMAEHYDPRVTAYFEFAFFTGMRPEEIVALRWSDIDFRSGSARIRRVRTFGGEREGSKTHAERDVELVSQALRALEAMRPFTYLRGPEADVFERPEFVPKRVLNLKTGMSYNAGKSNPAGPWLDSRSQSETFWKPTLLRLGIRARRAYNARHTFATTALSAGVAPGYIATQLGHANTKMLHEVYSRWIMGADKGVQRAAMEAAMRGAGDDPEKPLVPKTYPKSGLKIVSR